MHANHSHNPRRLNATESLAVIRYLASGGTIHRYAIGARSLPPNAESILKSGKRIPFYCHHHPMPHATA